MSRLLSLDLSTTVAGYSIFDEETEELIHINYYKFEEEKLIDRANELVLLLEKLINNKEFDIKSIGIEESLKSFRAGGTNAMAMISTSRINFLCQYLIKFIYKMNLIEVNVMNARNLCFPGFFILSRAQKGVKQKEIAFKMAINILGKDKFPTKILKSGINKGKEVFIDEASDMSDAWVIGKAILNMKKIVKVEKIKKIKKK